MTYPLHLILPIFEKTINAYLSFDPEIRARLRKLSERLVRIEVTGINWIFYLTVHNEKIILLPETNNPIDASLKGAPFAYVTALVQSWQDSNTPPQGIELSGDIHLIQKISAIFRSIEIDWEELLSNCTGDIIAHQVGNISRDLKNCFVETTETLKKNFSEYVQEEAAVLPPRLAIEDFYDDVYQLRDDVERISQKIVNIKEQKT